MKLEIDINNWVWDDVNLSLKEPWAVDFYSGMAYRAVYVRVNGKLYHTANHIKRPDVATVFNNPNYPS